MADSQPVTEDLSSQAGAGAGGGDSSSEPLLRAVEEVHAVMLQSLQQIFEGHAKSSAKWTAEQAKLFSEKVQLENPDSLGAQRLLGQEDGLDFNGFLQYMTSQDNTLISARKEEDLSWPLSSYFISSSHNTYLTGNQLSSQSTTGAYKNVLLRGCRCVEIDVWDGDESDLDSSDADGETIQSDDSSYVAKQSRFAKLKSNLPDSLASRLEKTKLGKKLEERESLSLSQVNSSEEAAKTTVTAAATADSEDPELVKPALQKRPSNEPRVLHGYTLTKEVSFRDVCMTIRENAFVASDLPVIVSLEVHCKAQQQEMMVNIMKEAFQDYLAPELDVDAPLLPSPGELKRKILIKVKFAPKDGKIDEDAAGDSGEEEVVVDATHDHVKVKAKKPSKIIQELSRLGIYTKAFSFKNWTQPEAKLPTHIFSIAEKKYLDHCQNNRESLFEHNRNYMLRAYPSAFRIGSSNLNPSPFWASGAQIVALNWQQTDEGMMLNEGMFADTAGYVLKPEGYRPVLESKSSYSNKSTAKTLSLSITFCAAQSIPLPKGDSSDKGFHPYMKAEIHVDTNCSHDEKTVVKDSHERDGRYKVRTKTSKSCNPDFKAEKLTFPAIKDVVDELTFLRFTIRDDEIGRDDLAAWACIRLDRLKPGYRFVQLWDSSSLKSNGVVLIKVDKLLV